MGEDVIAFIPIIEAFWEGVICYKLKGTIKVKVIFFFLALT